MRTHKIERPAPVSLRVVVHGLAVFVLGIWPFCANVQAQPYTVRDVAFVEDEEAFQLFLVLPPDADYRETFVEWTHQEASTSLENANIAPLVIELGGTAAEYLASLLEPGSLDPGLLPLAALVTPKKRALAVGKLPEGRITHELLRRQIFELLRSPLQLQLEAQLIDSFCVLLLVEGGNLADNSQALELVQQVAEQGLNGPDDPGRGAPRVPFVTSVSPRDESERVVLWCLGMIGADTELASNLPTQLAVIAGRGRLVGPILRGREITREGIRQSLDMLNQVVTEATERTWVTGPTIPLNWTRSMADAARQQLGFDPQDPAVMAAIRKAAGIPSADTVSSEIDRESRPGASHPEVSDPHDAEEQSVHGPPHRQTDPTLHYEHLTRWTLPRIIVLVISVVLALVLIMSLTILIRRG